MVTAVPVTVLGYDAAPASAVTNTGSHRLWRVTSAEGTKPHDIDRLAYQQARNHIAKKQGWELSFVNIKGADAKNFARSMSFEDT
jgi:hypothetical protein